MNERINLRFKAIIVLLNFNTLWISCTTVTETFYTYSEVKEYFTVFVMDVTSDYSNSYFNLRETDSRIMKSKKVPRHFVTKPVDGTMLTGDAKSLFEGIVNRVGVEILDLGKQEELSRYHNMADITTLNKTVNKFKYYDVYILKYIDIMEITTANQEKHRIMYFDSKYADTELVKCYKNAQSDRNFYYKGLCRHKSDLLAITGHIKAAIDSKGNRHLIFEADASRHPVYVEKTFQSDIKCGDNRISIGSQCQSTDNFETADYAIEERKIYSTVFKKTKQSSYQYQMAFF